MNKRIARLNRKIRARLGIDVTHNYGTFEIELPADHLLPVYQREHPLYDRFLPHLATFLPANSTVIDVGANCGDTLAAMFQHNGNLNYLCIEPDQTFFSYLERNVARILDRHPDARIQTVQALIGKAISHASLEGSGGTKKAIVGTDAGSMSSTTLDDLIFRGPCSTVSLLKSDVDGFDYDVLDSSLAIVARDQPLLFFECQLDQEFQKRGYERTLRSLFDIGYTCWTVFDNFGEILLNAPSAETLLELLDYLWRQNMGRSTRTINYFDLLAYPESRKPLARQASNSYLT